MVKKRPTILIVDDIVANVHILEEYLEEEYAIKKAHCGEDALGIAGTPPYPDMILLDVMMPRMNGYEVLEALKRNPHTNPIPVIFVTSLNDEEDEEKGFALGAVDYVIKPYKATIVKSRIRTHLELKEYRDSLERLVSHRTEKLEKAYADLKALDMAREKVMDHLSHELKTPLAVLRNVFDVLAKARDDGLDSRFEKAVARGERSVRKLIDIQEETEDICQEREILLETIDLNGFLTGLIAETEVRASERRITIFPRFDPDCRIAMDRMILIKMCRGLLKNAVESTPDEGRIDIGLENRDGKVRVRFRDYGVGITRQNQRQIFGGFYHTQDSSRYSTKQPYAFDAGGTGADLLRTKIFSERYGFGIDYASARCRFIPGEKERCPGRISDCPFVDTQAGCVDSGGSVFELVFDAAGGA